jgi:prepilin-type N-terminal cleavage/methylation domain-containing protein
MSCARASTKRGFTLIEVVVVLAVMAVIAALAVPSLVPWYNSYKATERQSNAELVYSVAENNMAKIVANGTLGNGSSGAVTAATRTTLASTLSSPDPTPALLKNDDGSTVDEGLVCLTNYNSSDAAALNMLVPNIDSQVSNVGFFGTNITTEDEGASLHAKGVYYLELNPQTGYVYGAFYSESASFTPEVYQSFASANRNDSAALASKQIAYYGGGPMKSFVHEQTLDDLVIGYFEFNGSELTGSYGYTISKFGEVSAQVHDNLPDNNAITKTAYGILSATELTGNDVPSHILENASVQKVSAASLGIEGLSVTGDGMYWFYEYDPSTLYDDSANTITRTSSAGVWKPWENAQASSQYRNVEVFLDPNFAAAIAPGSTNPFNKTFQVRTGEQLQHIGKPLDYVYDPNNAWWGQLQTWNNNTWVGSFYDASYLDGTYYQTHDIELPSNWVGIGQESRSQNLQNFYGSSPQFTGTFYGGYSQKGSATPDHANLQAPTSKAKSFEIDFAPQFQFASDDTAPRGQAYMSDNNYVSCGVFGYVSGTVSYLNLNVKRDLTVEVERPRMGLAICQLGGRSSATNCTLATNAAFSIEQTDDTDDWTGVSYMGGLIGSIADDAQADACAVTVSKPLTIDAKSDLWDSSAVYMGAIVGYDGSSKALSNCTLSVARGTTAKLSASTFYASYSGQAYLGGIVGYKGSDNATADSRAFENNKVTVSGTLDLEANKRSQGAVGAAAGLLQHLDEISSNSATCDKLTIGASGVNGAGFAGGLIGRAADSNAMTDNSLTLNQADISATGVNRSAVVGGFIGSVEDVEHVEQDTFKTSGRLEASSNTSNGNSYAGAALGWASDSSIAGLDASLGGTVDVSSTGGSSAAAGGLVGKSSEINASKCGVNVPDGASLSLASYGKGWGSSATGGLFGGSSEDTLSYLHVTAQNGSKLQFESKVDGQDTQKVNSAAGAIGFADGSKISNCYVNSASTSFTLNSLITSERSYDEANVVAGFLGVSSNSSDDCTIDSCFASGTFASSSNHGLAGFAGYLQSTTTRNSFFAGALQQNAGSFAYGFARANHGSGSIESCYSAATGAANNFYGFMDKWGAGYYSNCYYLKAPRGGRTAGTELDYTTMTAQSNGMASALGFGFASGSPFPTHTTDGNGTYIGPITYPAG